MSRPIRLSGICQLFLLFVLFSCNEAPKLETSSIAGGADGPPVVSNITLADLSVDVESIITLNYLDPNTDYATRCSVTQDAKLTITKACSCNAVGVCKVGIKSAASSTGPVSFDFNVTANGVKSNTARASFNLLPHIPFITIWDTTKTGTSLSTQITLPLINGGNYNFTVDWGDGSSETITQWNDPATTHTYASSGIYTVTMTGKFDHFMFIGGGDAKKLINITQWGSNQWATMYGAFKGCSNLGMTATDAPNLQKVTTLSRMFESATSFNGDLSEWDTSQVTDMSYLFKSASAFNSDISQWDTSKVTTMEQMFYLASAFNRDLQWDTSKVTTMAHMFYFASAFNGDLGQWDTSRVTTMISMFCFASAFNRDIGQWNTSQVTTMSYMFAFSNVFDQDLSAWDTSHVIDMSNMFAYTSAFNQDLSGWDVSEVIDSTDFAELASEDWTADRQPVFP